ARLWASDFYGTSEEQRKKQWEQIRKHEAIFWDSMDKDDPINPKLEAVILEIESTCQKVISGEGTLYGFLNKKLGRNN
ncbi:MAG: hypothetical protein WCA63_13410, partial [Gallionella sp.]